MKKITKVFQHSLAMTSCSKFLFKKYKFFLKLELKTQIKFKKPLDRNPTPELQSHFQKTLGPLSEDQKIRVCVWTTTPWTLPASRAVCIHPQIDYVLVQFENQRVEGEGGEKEGNGEWMKHYYLMAEKLVEDFEKEAGVVGRRLCSLTGDQLVGSSALHPLYCGEEDGESPENRRVLLPVLSGDHVHTSSGTGSFHSLGERSLCSLFFF